MIGIDMDKHHITGFVFIAIAFFLLSIGDKQYGCFSIVIGCLYHVGGNILLEIRKLRK